MAKSVVCDLCPKCDEWYDSEHDECPHCVKVEALETKWTLAEDALFRLRHSLKEIHDGMMDSAGSRPHVHEPIPGIREGWEYASCMGLMTEVLLLRGRTTGLGEAAAEVDKEIAAVRRQGGDGVTITFLGYAKKHILALDPPARCIEPAVDAGEKGG